MNAIDAATGGDAYANNVTSGRYVGYGSSGHPVTISRAGGFDFFGAYFGVGSRDVEVDDVADTGLPTVARRGRPRGMAYRGL